MEAALSYTPSVIGRSLELYYVTGHPDGMVLAEMYNWTGRVLCASRTQLAEAFGRPETSHTGVYLLLGDHEGEPSAYIGEAEDLRVRIKTHDVQKDWWTSVAFITTASANQLNKAHVRYLEARLVEEARRVGRTPLTNGVTPSRPGLSEADVSKMETFLLNLFMVLPALRVDVFVRRARPSVAVSTSDASSSAQRFVLTNHKHGLEASARLTEGEFIVDAGSRARLAWEGVGAGENGYSLLHNELVRSGVLARKGDSCVFDQAYAFKSLSAAASVVTGRSTNGRMAWRTPEGLTYKDWEMAHLQASEPTAG